ncbi:MAG: DUF2793 domain-containing protein [Rhizobiaceae bacterium]|nr:DUF2793 domain-containing protein [Rhizobiaceae bacterium]
MTATPSLELPHILPAQAQKHVTHNEALERLDTVVQLSVSAFAAAPPAAPAEGECFIVEAGAGGVFAGSDNKVARSRDGTWEFFSPKPGWRVWLEDGTRLLVWDGSEWSAAVAELPLLGVGRTADETTRFAVSSAASLFTHRGAGHQLKVNKAESGDTAAVLFQTGLSGRAEIGTVGDDDLHVKVSPDGSSWLTAMHVDATTGRVAFPNGGVRELLAENRTFHVRTDGDDGNDGRDATSDRAFATIQRAVDAALALDSGLSDIEILVAPGTYVGSVVVGTALAGRGRLILRGTGGAAADVVISAPGGHAVSLANGARLDVRRLTLEAASRGLDANNRAFLEFSDLDFGDCGAAHIYATDARIVGSGNYRITGDAPYHVVALTRAYITISYNAIDMPATRSFSGAFAFALSQAIIEAYSCTFTGTATGTRYYAGVAAIIFTAGGVGYFPGSVAGGVDAGTYALYV